MATDLKKLKVHAKMMSDQSSVWKMAVEIIDAAIANENITVSSERLKVEIDGNVKELARLKQEVSNEMAVLTDKHAQTAKLNDYLEGEYKRKELEQDKELNRLYDVGQKSIDDRLKGDRKKAKETHNLLVKYTAELDRVKAEIASMRKGLRGLSV